MCSASTSDRTEVNDDVNTSGGIEDIEEGNSRITGPARDPDNRNGTELPRRNAQLTSDKPASAASPGEAQTDVPRARPVPIWFVVAAILFCLVKDARK